MLKADGPTSILKGHPKTSENFRMLRTRWEYETALEWSWYVKHAGQILTPKVDAENLEEIDGIAEGLKAAGEIFTPDELVALNGYAELIGYWWPTVKDSVHSHSIEHPKESCSSFIATGSMTADGKIVLGHNTMDMYYNPMSNIIMDILPDKGHRILMQSVAGFVHSETDFFITDAGLVGSETTITPSIRKARRNFHACAMRPSMPSPSMNGVKS
jgi:hypothetical protein